MTTPNTQETSTPEGYAGQPPEEQNHTIGTFPPTPPPATPRTDKKLWCVNPLTGLYAVTADFARNLECELTLAKDRIDDLEAATIHSCGANCQRPMCVLRRELADAKAQLEHADKKHRQHKDELVSLHDIRRDLRTQIAAMTAERDALTKECEEWETRHNICGWIANRTILQPYHKVETGAQEAVLALRKEADADFLQLAAVTVAKDYAIKLRDEWCDEYTTARDERDSYKAKLEAYEAEWKDEVDQYTPAIDAAHPENGGSHAHFMQALEMVNHRHGKYPLVNLVNWLLNDKAKLEANQKTWQENWDSINKELLSYKAVAKEAVKLLDWAESIICSVEKLTSISQSDWEQIRYRWQEQKHSKTLTAIERTPMENVAALEKGEN